MIDSILTSVKDSLGLGADYTPFDESIILHINSVFSTLNQLGVGPANAFMIEDATATWDDFIGNDNRINSVKTYINLVVKSLFDPSDARFVIAATTAQINQLEWRLNVVREGDSWVDPEVSRRRMRRDRERRLERLDDENPGW